jgi:hypothetical protein
MYCSQRHFICFVLETYIYKCVCVCLTQLWYWAKDRHILLSRGTPQGKNDGNDQSHQLVRYGHETDRLTVSHTVA